MLERGVTQASHKNTVALLITALDALGLDAGVVTEQSEDGLTLPHALELANAVFRETRSD